MASISVPAAIAIGAGVSAAGSIGGSLLSGNAAKSAADTQAGAANQASANALQEYQQTRADLGPFRSAGTTALGGLSNLLTSPQTYTDPVNGGSVSVALPLGSTFAPVAGPDGTRGWGVVDANGNQTAFYPGNLQGAAQQLSATSPLNAYGLNGITYQPPASVANVLAKPQFNPTQAELESTPGYQFNLQQGLQAVQNSNAAKGLGVSGAALKGAASFATGLANNTLQTQADIFNRNFGNAVNANAQGANIFQSNLGNILNPLQNVASLGQNAAATTGQQGIQAVGNANNALIGGANALASGQVGSANALSGGISGLGNSALNYLLYKNFLGGNSGGGGFIDTTSTF